jgi:hypothetical protein
MRVRSPAADHFARRSAGFVSLEHLIKRREQSVVWGN